MKLPLTRYSSPFTKTAPFQLLYIANTMVQVFIQT